ncbi:hypothetical protein F383_23102 [Gossypium arboreum]|uniref:Uncharacterized protein n=1 Tax=Gossypium arboreum TaxID=29729 RepID=A0A0B0NYQ0_GOSAR|nr:hypothetical protein F383_23102 [Gossypium arboreum]
MNLLSVKLTLPSFPMFSSVARLARVGVCRRYYHTVKLSPLV